MNSLSISSIRSGLWKWVTNPLVASRPIVLFVVATTTMFGINSASTRTIPDVNLPLLYGLDRWDSGFYLGIATDGFGVFKNGYAFRPLFPLIIRLLYPAFPVDVKSAEVLAGFVWNLVALGIAAIFLERLTKLLLGPSIASRSLLLMAVFPSTFFFTAIYSEATCILFITGSLYCLETRRILQAGALGFLAGLARPEAFLVSIPFLVKALLEDQKLKKLVAGLTVLASVPAFGLYAYTQTGNVLAPVTAEATSPKCTMLCFLNNPVYQFANGALPYTINFVAMSLAISFVVYPMIKAKVTESMFPYYLWAFVLLAVIFYTGEVRSFARFAIVLPPVFWAQAEYSLTHPKFFQGLIVIYSLLMALATALFVNWYPML